MDGEQWEDGDASADLAETSTDAETSELIDEAPGRQEDEIEESAGPSSLSSSTHSSTSTHTGTHGGIEPSGISDLGH